MELESQRLSGLSNLIEIPFYQVRRTGFELELFYSWSCALNLLSTVLPNASDCSEIFKGNFEYQFSSVAQSCPTLCEPMDCSTPGLPVHHPLPELHKLMSIESVMPSKHLILCHPLLLLPSIFPSIRVFSPESALHTRWPKYWSFSFNISPSSEHSGLWAWVIIKSIMLQTQALQSQSSWCTQ